ncbi:MAG: type II toxin-antitoxin system mRNA interferase toxin, RelE/StbE family [Deltaproteobacteria bacterium]|nr:type II toxin-antitoxin system mRNA interferase toxin, RelE/StbE family [Deltaproteobacteria bacterium]
MYGLSFSKVVKKQQKKIPKADLEKIKKLLLSLQKDPGPMKCKKLRGGLQDYRIRYGDWRILYSVEDKKKQVLVYGILNRKEAYR